MILQQFCTYMEAPAVLIKSKISSSKCLTVRPKQELVLYDQKSDPYQRFTIVKGDLGQVYFRCQASDYVLTLKQEQQNDGVRLIEAPLENKRTQKFRMQEISPQSNEYLIYTFCGKVLDVNEARKKNNTAIHQWSFHGQDNQVWTLHKA